MKKKIKISLILSLAIIFGCFSNVFAASNQNNKAKKIYEVKKNVRLLDGTNDNGVDQYTKLLMDTDDNNFKDECGHIVTNNGVTLDTSNKKFGGGSAYFNGNSNLTLSNSDIDLETQNFTIDFWFYQTKSQTNNSGLFSIGDTWSSNAMAIHNNHVSFSNKLSIWIYNYNSESPALVSNTSLINNSWYHVAFIRDGVNCYLFLNGKLEDSIVIGNIPITKIENYYVGLSKPDSSNGYYNGNIDELRISNTARWTSDFTPPTAPYDNTLATGITLNKTTDLLNVNGTDTLTATVTPDNATNKTVKWTSSDPTIVGVDENTGAITASKDKVGTATITATTTDGTNLSASCTVTVTEPTNPTDNSDKAVLNITMTNGQVKQYNVTMDTVNKFIAWYRLRSAGSGNPFYEFDVTQTSSPTIIKTDYVVFDKISSFEVDDYTK